MLQSSYRESLLWIASVIVLAALWISGSAAFAKLSMDPSQRPETGRTSIFRKYLESAAGRSDDGMQQADMQVPGGSPGGGHMKDQKEGTRDVTLAEIAKKHPGNGMYSDKDMNGKGSMGVSLSDVTMKNVPGPMISAMQNHWPEFPKAGRLTGPGLEMAMETGLDLYSGMIDSPESQMHAAEATGQAQAEQAGDASADCARDQAASAIGFCSSYVENFTTNPIWNMVRNQIFVPMAVLLLLPGAALAQMRAIIAAGSPVLGEVNPFEGILRSIVAVFLIPGTALVVNYGIDLNNSIAFTINSEYFRIFGSDMYKDALCAEIRATPVRQPQTNRNAYDQPTYEGKPLMGAISAFGQFEGRMMENSLQDPCAGIDLAPSDRTNEAMSSGAAATRLMMNGSNASLAAAWNILCAFQLAYLYYLWCVGPIMAALWVYPLRTLRNALPSWTEGVITLCFWSLFWNTVILLMACFKGVDETGTVLMTALNFLATASVKYAFDFAGLVKAAGQEAAGMAAGAAKQAAQAGGGGAGKGGGACGSKSTGASATGSGANHGMQRGRTASATQDSRKGGHGAGRHGSGESTTGLVARSQKDDDGAAPGANGGTNGSAMPESRWEGAVRGLTASAGGKSKADDAPIEFDKLPWTDKDKQNAFFDALAAGLAEPPPLDQNGVLVACNDTNSKDIDASGNGGNGSSDGNNVPVEWQMYLQNQNKEIQNEQKQAQPNKALEVARADDRSILNGGQGAGGGAGACGLDGANGGLGQGVAAGLLNGTDQQGCEASFSEEPGVQNVAWTQPLAPGQDNGELGVVDVPSDPPPYFAYQTTGANASSLSNFTDTSLNSFTDKSLVANTSLSYPSQDDQTVIGNLVDFNGVNPSAIDQTPLSDSVALGNGNLPINGIVDGGAQPFAMSRDDTNGASFLGGGEMITFHPPGAGIIDQSQVNGGDISFNNSIAMSSNSGGTTGSTFSAISSNAPFNQLGGAQVTDPNMAPVGNGTAIFSSAPTVDAPIGPLPNTSVFANNTTQCDPNMPVNNNPSSGSQTSWSEQAPTYLSSNQPIANAEVTGLPSVNNSHHASPGSFDSFIQSSDYSANSTNTYASTYAPTYEHQGGGSSSVAPPAYTPSASQAGYAAYSAGGAAADANWQVTYSVPPTTSVTDAWFSSHPTTEVAYQGSAAHQPEPVYCQPSLGSSSTEVAYNNVAPQQSEQSYSYPGMNSSSGSSPAQVCGYSDLGLSMPIIPKHIAAQAAPVTGAEKITGERLTPSVSAMRPLNRLAKAMGRATCNSLPAAASQPTSVNSGATGGGTAHSGTVNYARYQPQALNGNEPPPVFDKMPDSLQSVVMLGNQRGGRNPKSDEEYESAMKSQLDAMTGANQIQS
jgi:hypothetical protein